MGRGRGYLIPDGYGIRRVSDTGMRIYGRVGVRDWRYNTRTRPAPLPCLALGMKI